jgi:2-polyprenyl-3-methyl-5-hydroxy-6-metoxy-1,4-benzoquinol methylase
VNLPIKQKDLLELKHWIRSAENQFSGPLALQPRYLEDFGLRPGLRLPGLRFIYPGASVLEIGTGPHWGMLPLIAADLRVGIDPLYEYYEALGILSPRGDIRYFAETFEAWDTGDTFDAILSADAIDHGEMGFHLLPKLARLLKPGGRLYIRVHLRPAELLNLIHDHSLTVESLDKHLGYTPLVEIRREILPHDVDWDCPTLIGIWQKPL